MGLSNAYVIGGYQSPSIILKDPDTNLEVPLGGTGSSPWDTTLVADKFYDVYVEIQTRNVVSLGSIKVRFWEFEGGLGSVGNPLGLPQTGALLPGPPNIIKCLSQFQAPSFGLHKCVAVSLSDFDDGSSTIRESFSCSYANTSAEVPDPLLNITESCSAWRNTSSRLVNYRDPWGFRIGLGNIPEGSKPGKIKVDIETYYVPVSWHEIKKAIETKWIFQLAGATPRTPLYLLPALRDTLEKPGISININEAKPLENSHGLSRFELPHEENAHNTFWLSGHFPKGVKTGDILLIKATAHYKGYKNIPARSVEFLQIFHATHKWIDEKRC